MATKKAPAKQKGRSGWVKWILIVLIGVPAVLTLFSFSYHRLAIAQDERSFPPPGQLVSVNDHQMHIACQGEGSPTVILEAGANSWSVVWSLVQDDIAQMTRVCAYDRAGFGWSEPGPLPRSASQIVGELHALLANAGVEGPYVMVGHSYGGPLVRSFAGQYPDEVVGMVLIDATHPDQSVRLPVDFDAGFEQQIGQFKLLGTLADLGFLRFGVEQFAPSWNLPEETLPAYFAFMARSEYYKTSVNEGLMFADTLDEVRRLDNLGDLPLVVLRADVYDEELAAYPGVDAASYSAARRALQEDLATLSSNSRLLVADHSGHLVQLYQPELVVEAVRQVLEMAK